MPAGGLLAVNAELFDALYEVGRYFAGSPRSRLRQLATLRELDDHLLADIGVTRRDAQRGRAGQQTGDSMTANRSERMTELSIRDASEADAPSIQAIYAHHVLRGLATFEEVAPTVDEMRTRRAAVIGAGLPYLVAERAGVVVGYCYATAYRPRPAYRHTIEDSVYVADGLAGRGIGRALLSALIESCAAGPWRQMSAVIGNSGNVGSIELHRRMGFEPVGTLRSVGFKFGQWVDTVLMQRALGAGDASLP